jgi:N-acetyl-gamma-glutamyl-phosphate reductase
MSTKPQVFIDGQEGTTGLRIREMLEPRLDVEVLLIPEHQRKEKEARAEFLNRADLAILCLPDDAAAEALELVENSATKIIDTSTARRVSDEWVYGLPEISSDHRDAIRAAKRVANCGCYPVSFILAVRPLIAAGLLRADAPLTINAASGYSGGGRKMIEAYDAAPAAKKEGDARLPFGLYGLTGQHKHVPEMWKFSLTQQAPIFVPSVDHSFCGMVASTPVPASYFSKGDVAAAEVFDIWRAAYAEAPMVRLVDPADCGSALRGAFLDLDALSYSNAVELSVWGDERGLVLVGRLDNLGKGASGNAVQCLNLMLGFAETEGLF